MSDDWRIGFKRALVDTILRLGSPCKPGTDWELYYGWEDYGARYDQLDHIDRVGIDYDKTETVESEWHEFKGTFYEGDNIAYGVDMRLMLLDETVYRWRFDRRLSDFIMELVKSDDEVEPRDKWYRYGHCDTCGVGAGRPCVDMRKKESFILAPHPGRSRRV